MIYRIKLLAWIGVAALSFLTVSGISVASSFPFREVEVGDAVPAATVVDYKTQKAVSWDGLRGRPFVVLFWGADIPAKKRRSIEALKELQKLQPFMQKRNVALLTINAQGDASGVIEEVSSQLEGSMGVYVDPEQTLYGKLGIYVMPAFLLVSGDGKVAAGMGYSHDLGERLQGEVEVLLGEKSRAQVEAELQPVVVEKSVEEKNAMRHRNMGFVMAQRGMPDAAIREFEAAVKLVPEDGDSLVELGCLYLEQGQSEKAGQSLGKGLGLEPGSLRGQICQARLKAGRGAVDEAVADLEALLLRNFRDPTLHYVLGTLFEKQGKIDKAAAEYRKGYELLERKDLLHEHKE